MSLLQDLSIWNGRSADEILEIYERHKNSDRFIKNIVWLIVERIEEDGATWLLKHHFEEGGGLSAEDIDKIYSVLPNMDDWEGRLHILQCIPYMPIEKHNYEVVEAFVRKGLTGDHKLIRAWSYNGFYELAAAFPELRPEAQEIFDKALQDEAASVTARIRNLLKKGFE